MTQEQNDLLHDVEKAEEFLSSEEVQQLKLKLEQKEKEIEYAMRDLRNFKTMLDNSNKRNTELEQELENLRELYNKLCNKL